MIGFVVGANLPKSCFFFAADANYFPYAVLAARRVIDISAPIDGYILATGVGTEDLVTAEMVLGSQVKIIDVSAYLSGFAAKNGRLGLSTYIRLFADELPELQGYERIIYADSDILFNRSIADLATIDLTAPLLAAHDVQSYFEAAYRRRLPLKPGAPMFNAGVLMFNMPLVREGRLLERSRQFAVDNPDLCVAYDQDALNVTFEGQWQTMHPAWNAMTNFSGQMPFSESYARHFSWGKPWWEKPLGVEPEAMSIYRDLARDTPWASRFIQDTPHIADFLKRLTRKFDGMKTIFLADEKLSRRSRFDFERANAVFISHAERGLLAVQNPETAAGFS